MKKVLGFTLVELMITVAIVGILAGISVPYYTDYVRRADLSPAVSTLSDLRLRMEQYYQDNRTYLNGAVCGVPVPAAAADNKFTYTCPTPTATTYTWRATGNAGTNVAGFVFNINQSNVKSTTAVHSSWGAVPASGATSWVTKKGG